MTDWAGLRHAYGPATDVPDMLADLESSADTDVLDEIWGCLCHQETAYSASFAALPELLRIAACFPPGRRLDVLILAGAILVSGVVGGSRYEFMRGLEPTIEGFRKLAHECLNLGEYSQAEFVCLLQAICAFEGDALWGHSLDNLNAGYFPAVCPNCGRELDIVVGVNGVFAADHNSSNKAVRPPTILTPTGAPLDPPGNWMRDQAIAAGQADIAEWLTYLFGTGRCAECDSKFSVPGAVGRAHRFD